MTTAKVVLITGAARRVGAEIARTLHAQGMQIAIHYRSSADDAHNLCQSLNEQRPDSAVALQADLHDTANLPQLVDAVVRTWGRLDVLINNASNFYPTPIGKATEDQWNDLLGSNLKAPFFLAQASAPALAQSQGCIINMVDIHAQQPLKSYPIYCMAKAGLLMMTKALAKELGPHVRVNAIAPGAVLWPEDESQLSKNVQDQIIARTALKREGTPADIANTIVFLVSHADYITGQVLAVDGGRSLNF